MNFVIFEIILRRDSTSRTEEIHYLSHLYRSRSILARSYENCRLRILKFKDHLYIIIQHIRMTVDDV